MVRIWECQVTPKLSSLIFFLYLCCKIFLIFFSPAMIKEFFPLSRDHHLLISNSEGLNLLCILPWPRKSGVAPSLSMNLLMICIDVTEANLVQGAELQLPWQQAAVWEAEGMFSGEVGTPASTVQPWDENVSYIWSPSPGLYFWHYQWTLGKIASHCLSTASSKIGIVLHRSVLKIDSVS